MPSNQMGNQSMSEAFLRLPAVKALVGLGKTEIYARVRTGRFPKPIKLAPRVTVWRASEVDAYVNQVIRDARAEAT